MSYKKLDNRYKDSIYLKYCNRLVMVGDVCLENRQAKCFFVASCLSSYIGYMTLANTSPVDLPKSSQISCLSLYTSAKNMYTFDQGLQSRKFSLILSITNLLLSINPLLPFLALILEGSNYIIKQSLTR